MTTYHCFQCRNNLLISSLVAQSVKNLPVLQETWFSLWDRKIPWRRKWQPTPVFLPGEFHGWRSLADVFHGVAGSRTWLSKYHSLTHTLTLRKKKISPWCYKRERDLDSDRSYLTLPLTFYKMRLHIVNCWVRELKKCYMSKWQYTAWPVRF